MNILKINIFGLLRCQNVNDLEAHQVFEQIENDAFLLRVDAENRKLMHGGRNS